MVERTRQHGFSFDRPLLFLLLVIISIGLVMVSSASFPLHENPYHYFTRQLVFVGIGLVLMFFIGSRDIHRLNSTPLVVTLLAVSGVLLALCFVPGIAAPANGARRWLQIGPISGQPSEIAKGAALLFFAHFLARKGEDVRDFWRGVLPVTLAALVIIGGIIIEPDLGGSTMVGLLMMVMLFLAGARLRVLGLYALGGLTGFVALMLSNPYQLRRLMSFLHPWDDPTGTSYQIKNSLIALGRGGLTGVGVGNGMQKLFFLPEIHNDFILANLGEELGLLGLWLVFILFGLLVFRSMRLAMRCREPFARLIGAGAAALLGLQVVVNAAVVMCLAPTKGLAIPFLSYGGSSAVLNFSLIGLILAVGRAGGPKTAPEAGVAWHPLRDRRVAGLEEPCSDVRNTSIS